MNRPARRRRGGNGAAIMSSMPPRSGSRATIAQSREACIFVSHRRSRIARLAHRLPRSTPRLGELNPVWPEVYGRPIPSACLPAGGIAGPPPPEHCCPRLPARGLRPNCRSTPVTPRKKAYWLVPRTNRPRRIRRTLNSPVTTRPTGTSAKTLRACDRLDEQRGSSPEIASDLRGPNRSTQRVLVAGDSTTCGASARPPPALVVQAR